MEVNRQLLIRAALLTLALFAVSLVIGYKIESDAYAKTESHISQLEDGLQTSLLFLMFMETHNESGAMCPVLKTQIDDAAAQAYDLYGVLEQGKGTDIFIGYDALRNKYFLANMRFYLMLREYMQTCNVTGLRPILFFYTAYNDCPACVAQGKVLDQVRAECPDARVYAFPTDVPDVAMIKYFTQYYGVRSAPALVINDQAYAEPMSREKIGELIGCTK